MLVGLYPPTSGEAFIHSKALHTDLRFIHTMMGVCTQYDILWDNLTGREHLLFYGRLRHMHGKLLSDEVDLMLKKFNLFEARFDSIPLL